MAVEGKNTWQEADPTQRIIAQLQAMLPSGWATREEAIGSAQSDNRGSDRVIAIETGSGFGRIAVDIKRSMSPRDVAQAVDRLRLTRRLDIRVEHLIAAPWLSPTTRTMLLAEGINYLDLTGNVHVHLQQPALYLHTQGAEKDPNPPAISALTLKGPQVGRLVRALVDFTPPYTASAIAAGSGISISYASRQLAELDREALVERDRRGGVVARDWDGLLRARARHYSTLSTNRVGTYISQAGARGLYGQLFHRAPGVRAVTGSFAASQIAPVAAPAQLMLYVDDPLAVAEHYGLLPADSGADVLLLQSYDAGLMFERATVDDQTGLLRLAMSQLALDCLSGNGRMPAEGDALLEWMAANPESWQRDLSDAGDRL